MATLNEIGRLIDLMIERENAERDLNAKKAELLCVKKELSFSVFEGNFCVPYKGKEYLVEVQGHELYSVTEMAPLDWLADNGSESETN